MPADSLINEVIRRMQAGQGEPGELFPLVYQELRRKAQAMMAGERPNHTLQATALVNEAFVKMTGGKDMEWASQRHFYNAASDAMRHILLDHARRKRSEKRGGNRDRVDLQFVEVAAAGDDVDLEGLDLALTKLQALDERRYQIVMYRYFSGLEEQQIANLLGVALKTVQRNWKTAKMFLATEMARGSEGKK